MSERKPIFLIEYPEYYSQDTIDDITNDFSARMIGYHVIVCPKDVEHINFKFN